MRRKLARTLFALLPVVPWLAFAAPAEIRLSGDCPPGFEFSAGQCKLRSLYQMYDSLENSGVGGLKTGLPAYRDGFSPQQIDLGRYLFFDPVLSGDGAVSCASCSIFFSCRSLTLTLQRWVAIPPGRASWRYPRHSLR